jgi:hypothetical protein
MMEMVHKLKEQLTMVLHLAERIDERVERIDIRTEAHTEHLSNIAGLKNETARIANALERIGEKHANRMFVMAVAGLVLLTTIIFLLISAYTKTPLKFSTGPDMQFQAGQ